MRLLARWFVVIAFFCAVVSTGIRPAIGHVAPPVSGTSASTDGASSGFKSTPAPERPAYIGPGAAIAGSTVINALAPASSIVAWRLPSRAAAIAPLTLHVPRLALHLRSIPLLI
jgi:hypothetical protein